MKPRALSPTDIVFIDRLLSRVALDAMIGLYNWPIMAIGKERAIHMPGQFDECRRQMDACRILLDFELGSMEQAMKGRGMLSKLAQACDSFLDGFLKLDQFR